MSIFSQIDLNNDDPEPNDLPLVPSADVIRKGKKNVPYTEDPEILSRLSRVASMLLRGFPAWKIGEALNYPVSSAKRDIKRVRQLWRQDAKSQLSSEREQALAQYKLALAKAWELVDQNPERADRYLALVLSAQERIDKLTGANASDIIEVKGEMTVKDIEQVRRERWAQVREGLGAIGEV